VFLGGGAYVCDLTSFYDDVFSHESYVVTRAAADSRRRLRRSIGLCAAAGGAVAALAGLGAL